MAGGRWCLSRARRLRVGIWIAVFATVPQAQDEDVGIGNLAAHLVLPDDDPADLPRCKRIQLLTNARIVEQPVRRAGELLNDARSRPGLSRVQEFVQGTRPDNAFRVQRTFISEAAAMVCGNRDCQPTPV